MLHSRLRFHQVDDQGPQQLCPHLLRRIPTYGPLQVCKTLHIIELFAFHALVRFRTHRKKRKSEIRRKKLEGGHVAEYPTPEAVVRRCVKGLARRGKDEGHDDNDADGDQKISQHGLPLRVRWEYWERLSET